MVIRFREIGNLRITHPATEALVNAMKEEDNKDLSLAVVLNDKGEVDLASTGKVYGFVECKKEPAQDSCVSVVVRGYVCDVKTSGSLTVGKYAGVKTGGVIAPSETGDVLVISKDGVEGTVVFLG